MFYFAHPINDVLDRSTDNMAYDHRFCIRYKADQIYVTSTSFFPFNCIHPTFQIDSRVLCLQNMDGYELHLSCPMYNSQQVFIWNYSFSTVTIYTESNFRLLNWSIKGAHGIATTNHNDCLSHVALVHELTKPARMRNKTSSKTTTTVQLPSIPWIEDIMTWMCENVPRHTRIKPP